MARRMVIVILCCPQRSCSQSWFSNFSEHPYHWIWIVKKHIPGLYTSECLTRYVWIFNKFPGQDNAAYAGITFWEPLDGKAAPCIRTCWKIEQKWRPIPSAYSMCFQQMRSKSYIKFVAHVVALRLFLSLWVTM